MTAEDTLKQWQDEAATVRAGIGARGVATVEQLQGLTGLEQMQRLLSGDFPAPPISETMDFGLLSVEFGRAIFQGKPSTKLLNPMGTVHGGWYATLLDSAVGCAVHTAMPVGRAYTTLELKLNIVRGISLKVPLVRAEGYTVHVGRQTATAEGRLYGADGTLYAHASTTCLVFEMPNVKR
jgi:uncharacterized protein (TIGR00369 family)